MFSATPNALKNGARSALSAAAGGIAAFAGVAGDTTAARGGHSSPADGASGDRCRLFWTRSVVPLALPARDWWAKRLSPRARRTTGCLAVGCLLATLFAYWLYRHTETVRPLAPAAGPAYLQLYAYDQAELVREAERIARRMIEGSQLLDIWHPTHRRARAAADRLTRANRALLAARERAGNPQWPVRVLVKPWSNAYVRSDGSVYVTTGMVEKSDDDELCVVIGHEFAHYLMRDTNATRSVELAVRVVTTVPLIAILLTQPPVVAVLASALICVARKLLVVLPYRRMVEHRADRLGLLIAANACVDVTCGRRLWLRSDMYDPRGPRWIKTHPTNESRAEHMHRLESEAYEYRESAGCPPRPSRATGPRN